MDRSWEPLLIVDDEAMIRDSLSQFLGEEGFVCETAASGAEALERLASRSFALVMSDINMPDLNGLELLASLSRSHADVAVMMITGVADLQLAVRTMKDGACDYITKPFELDQVLERVERALSLRRVNLENKKIAEDLADAVHAQSLALDTAMQDLQEHREMTLEALVRALDAREHGTQVHSQRVQAYTIRLARQFDFNDKSLVGLARGALLHDIGKIGVSDQILLKPGRLTGEERAEMMKHPVIGYEMVQGMKFLGEASTIVLCHHERFDGSGYPHGLRGPDIPFWARIFAVVDAYDAMTSQRCYHVAMSPQHARQELIRYKGSHFDPAVVDRFLEVPQEDWNRIQARLSDPVTSKK